MGLVWLLSCGDPQVAAPSESAALRPHVVVVTLDTTRADHIGAYGRAEARTPTIDRLANEGLRFDRAYSPIPLTIPAHATLFTGLDPYHHGIRDNGSAVLEARFTTLAEYLSAAGWTTAASVAAFVTQRRWGLCQGFETCLDALPPRAGEDRQPWSLERRADEVVDDALAWWAGRDPARPALLWVHVYDAHRPFDPPEPYRSEMEGLPYDAEIAFVDAQLARLREVVEAGERPVLWLVVGDHGEAVGEHGEREHGWYVYNATQRVPFILSGHGVDPGRVSEPVGLVDAVPTLLRHLELPMPDGLDGRPQPGGSHPIYLETWQLFERFGYAPHLGLVDGPWKLIATPRPELYNQLDDPGEREDLAVREPERLAGLLRRLEGLGAAPPARPGEIDAGTLARLQALGYIGGSGSRDLADAADPKDHQAVLGRVVQVTRDIAKGRLEEAEGLLRETIPLAPGVIELRLRLVRLLIGQGRTVEAQAEVEALLALEGADQGTWTTAVALVGGAGDHQAARELAEQGLRSFAESPLLEELLLVSLLNLDRPTEAVERGMAWVEVPGESPGLSGPVGLALVRSGRGAEALPWLEAGLGADRVARGVRQALVGFSHSAAEAEDLLAAELEDYPDNLVARAQLVALLDRQARFEEALAQSGALLERDPRNVVFLHARAQTLFNLGDLVACRRALEEALAVAPEDSDLFLLLANLLHREGRLEEALEASERANELHQQRLAGER